MHPTDHYLRINSIPCHWLDFGNPGKPTLICLHGLTRNARDFLPVGDLLSDLFHVVAVDIRGRGDSGWGDPADYHLAQYVEDLHALLDAWGLATASLLGTSMGGLIAILFAARFPHREERIVLNDVGPETSPGGIERILRTTIHAPTEFKDRKTLIEYFRSYFPTISHCPDEEVWDFAQSSIKASKGGGWTWKMDSAVRQALLDQGNSRAAPDLWTAFQKIDTKCLILRGAQSDVLSPGVLSKMQHSRTGITTAEVPNVGHTPLLSEPSAREALRNFFLNHRQTVQEKCNDAVEACAGHG